MNLADNISTMTEYIPLSQFIQKYNESQVEFKMYVGNQIQSDSDYKTDMIAGISKQEYVKKSYDDYATQYLDSIKNADAQKLCTETCTFIQKRFERNIKIYQIAKVESDIIKDLRNILAALPNIDNHVEFVNVWEHPFTENKLCRIKE